MRDKFVKILEEKGRINMTEVPFLDKEFGGEFTMYVPVPPGESFNPNILICHGVSSEFIKMWNELNGEELIDIKPENVMNLMFDGSPVYDTKVAVNINGTAERWLPVSIALKKK